MSLVWVYIDGFNLYNGCVKQTNYKWLNLYDFATRLNPADQVGKVKYFTARVQSRPNDPDQHIRQQVYWQALRTISQIEIIEGHFLKHEVMMPTAASVRAITGPGQYPQMVQVVKTEEKGTDVNLAVHLVNDAHKNRFDAAVIISNDSDLVEASKIVRGETSKIVGVYTPRRSRSSQELQTNASFFRQIPNSALRSSLFPDPVTQGTRIIAKPSGW